MFTIIFEKATGKVLNITSESDLSKVRAAMGDEYDAMSVETLPQVIPYRQYMRVVRGSLLVENKVLTNEQEREIQKVELSVEIGELKDKLAASDYKAIKFAEGELGEAEFYATRLERRAARAKINELEAKLEALNK